jgi:integrase
MNQLVPITSTTLRALVAAAGERAGLRFLEFFTANVRSPHARRAYARAADEFLAWCVSVGVPSNRGRSAGACSDVDRGRHARARGAERQATARCNPPSVQLARYRSSRAAEPGRLGARAPARCGPAGRRWCSIPPRRALLDSIDTASVVGLRDRALIGLMVYSFARIGAALGMAVENVYTQNCRLWVRLREKGGKRHAMPCHRNLEEYHVAYLDDVGLRNGPKRPSFRTIGRGTGKLTRTVMPQANVSAMISRRGRGRHRWDTSKVGRKRCFDPR